MVIVYRAVATRDGQLIALGKSRGQGRWTDGQIYYVPANSNRAFAGYDSNFNLLREEIEFERNCHPDWDWRLQRAEWTPKAGLSPWIYVSDKSLPL